MSYTNRGFDTEEKINAESMKRKTKNNENLPKIYVIGSGDFGRALASRLAKSGYSVTIASRDTARNRDLIPPGVGISDISSVSYADVVLVAIPFPWYSTLPTDLLTDKIVVDVSNRNRNGGMQGSKQVYVAGDDTEARDVVSGIVRTAGFTPVDMGLLTAAREIEDIPVSVFQHWRSPFYIHLAIFSFLYVLSFVKMQICWPITWAGPDGSFLWELWNHIPMDTMNKTLAVHALITLSLCYLPGVLAGWLQIFRGTKYSRFPAWLDNWLKMRKQLGILMFFAACVHACLSVAYMSPTYHGLVYGEPVVASVHVMEGSSWGPQTESENRTSVKIFGTEKMSWRGECFLMTGVLGFALVSLLAVTSLPSVTASLTWKEFTFVQSGLGWLAMILLCGHDMFYGWKYLNGPSCGIPSSFQYALYIPFLTILLKIPLVLPPISSHLDRIRSGYVRTNLILGNRKKNAKNNDTMAQTV